MNCFKHPQTASVGICKACNKGLCIECAADLGHGLACKGEHEEMVETYDTIIKGNAKVYENAGTNSAIGPVFYLFMGLVFAGYGYFSDKGVTGLPFVLGVGFIVFGVISFARNKKTFGNNET